MDFLIIPHLNLQIAQILLLSGNFNLFEQPYLLIYHSLIVFLQFYPSKINFHIVYRLIPIHG